MTFYEQQVLSIRKQHFPQAYQVRRIVKAKRFIDSNLSAPINLSVIAHEASLSKFHFIRLFRKCYGRTPHQYRTEQRLIKARELVKSGLSTTEICYALNFSSITTFIGLFKKYTGFTPTAYAQKSNFEEPSFDI
ncbi:helix-turn-helix transcriptional regulator [Spirosoma sp. BT702]|uniref:Helix-turn-helix transcriptional regulator n=1 Tax=Spirosoma profusum TaxID=2771354 RepID=A0A926XWG7_9BACT|nr:AraC family transcriptional regulator [Spirosoma profusum]MBD2701191.1 helix-turn-helix transcriptional regulator [Spirosoma profusum]